MKKCKSYITVCLLALLSCVCCKTETGSKHEFNSTPVTMYIEVDTAKAQIAPFYREYLTSGTLKAKRNYQLISPVSGMLKELLVVPGQYLNAGDVIAVLENKEIEAAFESKRVRLNKALIELESLLLGYGFSIDDTSKVPEKTLKTVITRSDYELAEIEYRQAKQDVENLLVKTSFNGQVANIQILQGQQTSKGDMLCNLLDTKKLTCEFTLIEDDFSHISKGQSVNISPYSLKSVLTGTIFAKNPEISEDGLFTAYAEVNNPERLLVNGMRVQVGVLAGSEKKLIIPKEAVVRRSDDNIVFTYSEDKAIWNFVEITSENSKYVAISNGISEGDAVITKGNMFLNNNSPVKIKSNVSK